MEREIQSPRHKPLRGILATFTAVAALAGCAEKAPEQNPESKRLDAAAHIATANALGQLTNVPGTVHNKTCTIMKGQGNSVGDRSDYMIVSKPSGMVSVRSRIEFGGPATSNGGFSQIEYRATSPLTVCSAESIKQQLPAQPTSIIVGSGNLASDYAAIRVAPSGNYNVFLAKPDTTAPPDKRAYYTAIVTQNVNHVTDLLQQQP